MRRPAIHHLKPRRALAAVLLACLGLTACQAVPSSGPVREGLANLSQADQPWQFNPGGPIAGASQEDIVRGFVRAASSSADDYAIAREFLAPSYSDQWDPSLGVLVDEGTQQYETISDAVGVLSLQAIATVAENGVLRPVGPGAATEVRFELEQVGGEWRIVSAPAGIILDKSTFAAVWTPLQIYFLSSDNRLVPDTRWFLNRRATMSTQLVGELLDGPSEDMGEVLHSAFPAGTVLTSGSVPVVDGTARIDLSVELFDAETSTLELVKRQLGASLQSVADVARFEILVNGSLIDEGPVIAAEGTSPSSENQYVAVLHDGVFGRVGSSEITPLPEIGERIAALSPTAVTLAPNRQSAAVLHSGIVTWVSANDQVDVDVRPGLLQPSLDRFGNIWTYSSSAPGEVLVTLPGQRVGRLAMPWLGGREPKAVRISQGGSRIAVLVTDSENADQSKVFIAGVVRDSAGVPVALTDNASVELWATGTPVDLDWIDEQRYVVVSKLGGSGKVTQGVLGQFSIESGSVPGAAAVSGGGARSLLRVLNDDGRLYQPQGSSGWQMQQDEVQLVAKVG